MCAPVPLAGVAIALGAPMAVSHSMSSTGSNLSALGSSLPPLPPIALSPDGSPRQSVIKVEAMVRQGSMITTILNACADLDEAGDLELGARTRAKLQGILDKAERAVQQRGDASDWLCGLETEVLEVWTAVKRR